MLSSKKLTALRESEVAESGNRLALALALAEMTQAQLSERIGFTQSYISRIANGLPERMPLETARTFANFFGCSIEELFPERQAVA